MDLPKLPKKVPLWVPVAIAGVAVGGWLLLRPTGGGGGGESIAVIQLPGSTPETDPEPEPEPDPEPGHIRIRIPRPTEGKLVVADPDTPEEPETTLDVLVKAWADAQEQLAAHSAEWKYADWSKIWQEILRNPTIFTGTSTIRKAFLSLSAALMPGLNQINEAYEQAKAQLGAQHSAWKNATLREIVSELKRQPQLMQGQHARKVLTDLSL